MSPKAEPEERTLVQVVYVEGDPGSRSEGMGQNDKGKGRINLRVEVIGISIPLKSVQNAFWNCPAAPTPP